MTKRKTTAKAKHRATALKTSAPASARVASMAREAGLGVDELEAKFDAGEDITEHLDLEKATKFVNVEFPLWMVHALDREANRLGVPRQAVIKMWLDEKLQQISEAKKSAV